MTTINNATNNKTETDPNTDSMDWIHTDPTNTKPTTTNTSKMATTHTTKNSHSTTTPTYIITSQQSPDNYQPETHPTTDNIDPTTLPPNTDEPDPSDNDTDDDFYTDQTTNSTHGTSDEDLSDPELTELESDDENLQRQHNTSGMQQVQRKNDRRKRLELDKAKSQFEKIGHAAPAKKKQQLLPNTYQVRHSKKRVNTSLT
jgi:hypothetical protein